MGITNILDLNNRVGELEDRLDGLYNGLIKIDTKKGSFTPATIIPQYFSIEDKIFDDVTGYTIIGIFMASGSPSDVLFGAVSEYNITNGSNHKKLYVSYASRVTTAIPFIREFSFSILCTVTEVIFIMYQLSF